LANEDDYTVVSLSEPIPDFVFAKMNLWKLEPPIYRKASYEETNEFIRVSRKIANSLEE
jgi:hypothetical protein